MANPPLDGVRVLDFSWAWAGPFSTLQLAHLGAEVIRLESAKRPCVTRAIPPFADNQPGPNRAGYFNQYNQGKRSVPLDIRSPAGAEIVTRLVKLSDVVVENFAGGVIARMGFGYDALRADQAGPHHAVDLRLRPDGAVQRLHRLRAARGCAVGVLLDQRISGDAAGGDRYLVRRSERRRLGANPSSPRCSTARRRAKDSTSIFRSGRRRS